MTKNIMGHGLIKTASMGALILFMFSLTALQSWGTEFEESRPWLGGLDTGVFVIATVDLNRLLYEGEPNVEFEMSIMRTEWTMNEIRTCWDFDSDNCVVDKTEYYVRKFIEFYDKLNAERRAKKRLELEESKN